MSVASIAVAGIGLVAGVAANESSRKAGNRAAAAQERSANAGIAEQQRQFDALQELLKPYIASGQLAHNGQLDLLGLNGDAAQQKSVGDIANSSQFSQLSQQGEQGILQNASATGGLRGGNTQAALAQFRPALLQNLIETQYQKLGGIAQMGQNSATMQATQGMQLGGATSALMQQQGASQAGMYLNQGVQNARNWNNVGQFGGVAAGAIFSQKKEAF